MHSLWKPVLVSVGCTLLFFGWIYVRVYRPRAAEVASWPAPAALTAQQIGCRAMWQASMDGQADLTPRDRAYCGSYVAGF